jgi:hypothetical protein
MPTVLSGCGAAGPRNAQSNAVDTISFGPDREPRWRLRRRVGRRGLLVIVAAGVAVAALAGVYVRGHSRPATAHQSGAVSQDLLTGIPARGVHTDLILGGNGIWRVGSRIRSMLPGLARSGLSRLPPMDEGAEVDQLLAVKGGVVAHISDSATGINDNGVGPVVFIPDGNAPARIIAVAAVAAVVPGSDSVWVQNAVQSKANGQGVSGPFHSPTWAVNLDGQRVSPVLQLPLGLVGATSYGPLTQSRASQQLQLWNGTTGRATALPLPADATFVAMAGDRIVSLSCGAVCRLNVTDLAGDETVSVPMPSPWIPQSATLTPAPADFSPTGGELVIALDHVGFGDVIDAADLFLVDLVTRSMRPLLPAPMVVPVDGQPAVTLAGVWDRHGVLWLMASADGSYQLGRWTSAGPVQVLAPGQGDPIMLTAPGAGLAS